MTTRMDVHVRPAGGGDGTERWRFSVNGVDFGEWTQCRALRLALKAARALSTVADTPARIVIHGRDGAVRSVLSFGEGRPLRLRRRHVARAEARLPLPLLARFSRDLAYPPT